MVGPVETEIDGALAARLRALRAERGLTLDGLAERSGVSRAMLSRIERGESSPTAQLLARLASGLGLPFSALFAGLEAPRPLLRRAEQPVWRDPETGYLRRIVSPGAASGAMAVVEITVPERTSLGFADLGLIGAGQVVWLLEGALSVDIGTERYDLVAGDSLMVRLDRPVRYTNPAAEPVRYAIVTLTGAEPRDR